MSYKKKEVIGDCVLYLGDCMEVMPTLGKVDAVVTDPPYAEKTHKGARTGNGNKVLIDFDALSENDFITLCQSLVEISRRWVVMTCDWRHAALAELSMPDEFIRAGVWVKPNGRPQYTGDRPSTGWESIAILHRKGKKVWNGGGSHAVWNIPKVHGNHPTEKPIALISDFIKKFTNEQEKILDPFMGSGTTGVACAKMGRKFIGIELDEDYFNIACERIREAYAQPDMFVQVDKKEAVQVDMF